MGQITHLASPRMGHLGKSSDEASCSWKVPWIWANLSLLWQVLCVQQAYSPISFLSDSEGDPHDESTTPHTRGPRTKIFHSASRPPHFCVLSPSLHHHNPHTLFPLPLDLTTMAPSIDKLADDNYYSWCLYLKGYLDKIGCWEIVTGESERPMGSDNSSKVKAWLKLRRLAVSEITLHVSEKYIGLCESDDPKEIWDTLTELFRVRSQGAVAFSRRRFNTMEYTLEKSMKEWITEVETLARQLDRIGSPMHTLDIYNTLVRNLPSNYRPTVALLDSLPTDPADPNCLTIPIVIKRLLNEESRIQATFSDFDVQGNPEEKGYHASVATLHAKRCFNCGEEGHIKADCDVSPRQLRERKEQRVHPHSRNHRIPSRNDAHAKVAGTCTHCAHCSDESVRFASDHHTGSDIFLF